MNENKRVTLLLAAVVLSVTAIAQTPAAQSPDNTDQTYDVIIRHGKIIDGSGNPWISGDVALRGDRIAEIGYGTAVGPDSHPPPTFSLTARRRPR